MKLEKSNLTKELSDFPNLKDEIQNKIKLIEKNESILINAQSIINKNLNKFTNGKTPFDYNDLYSLINKKYSQDKNLKLIKLNLKDKNPIISDITLDLSNDKLYLSLHKDLIKIKNSLTKDKKDIFEQLIFNEIAKISNQTNEHLVYDQNEININLDDLENSKSFLVLKLNKIAKLYVNQIKNVIDS